MRLSKIVNLLAIAFEVLVSLDCDGEGGITGLSLTIKNVGKQNNKHKINSDNK